MRVWVSSSADGVNSFNTPGHIRHQIGGQETGRAVSRKLREIPGVNLALRISGGANMQSSAWTPILVTVISILCFIHGASRAEALCALSNRTFVECKDLSALGATFAWTLHNDTNTIDFAFEGTKLNSTTHVMAALA